MYWLKSLLFYKASFLLFSSFTTLVLSLCSPEINNDVFLIRTSNIGQSTIYQFNILNGDINPNAPIYTVPIVDPHFNEVFLLTQSVPDSYEFRPFADFARRLVIAETDAQEFRLIINASGNEQQFIINCAECNSVNSEGWTPYYTSCTIMNKRSNLCMNGVNSNGNLNKAPCDSATKWDLIGRTSTDVTKPNCPATTKPTDNIQISKGGLAATVLGSIIGTSLIALGAGYWFIQRKRIYPGHALNI